MDRKKRVIKEALEKIPNLKAVRKRLEEEPEKVLAGGGTRAATADEGVAGEGSNEEGGFESMPARGAAAGSRGGAESRGATAAPSRVEAAMDAAGMELLEAGKRAIVKVERDGEDADLSLDETSGFEAIIRLVGRPALLIQNGSFFPPPPEWQALESERTRIQKTFKSVGRIEVTGHPEGLNWVGTGFIIAPNVIITNRHVAKEFCRMRPGGEWVFEPDMTAQIDFNEELGAESGAEYKIRSVIGVHETYDMALFEVAPKRDDGTPLPPPLPLSSAPPQRGGQVYIVGYPASDSRRNDPEEMRRIFSNVYDVKRLQPGEVMSVSNTNALFAHDCSTLGGNSGSAVTDLRTNQIVGLHYSGVYLEHNRAIALAKLADDPLLSSVHPNFV